MRLNEEVGPDALIVQDLGVAAVARQAGFTGELHLSTLACVTHPLALKILPTLGITRVVLPRELSIDEMRDMKHPGKKAVDFYEKGEPITGAVPIILINTSHGTGSECDSFAVAQSDGEDKPCIVSPQIYSTYTIEDPALTATMDVHIGIECRARHEGRPVKIIWTPRGISQPKEFSDFLASPGVREFMM